MESEDEGKGGKTSQTKIVKKIKKIKKIKVNDIYGSWDLSIWLFVGVIIVSALLILSIMLLLPFGLNPINRRAATVRSNSMEPTFERGDIVFVKDVDPQQIEEGDVIVVKVPEQYKERYGYPPLVVHRVTEVNDGHLFDVDRSEAELEDGRPVPDELRERFEEENQSLEENANITLSNGEWWITVGGEQNYRLKDTGEELQVYEPNPGPLYFETKGDAKNQADPFLTPPQNVVGQYSESSIPYLGLLFMFAHTTSGMMTLVLAFTLTLIALYFPWHIDKKEERISLLRSLKEGISELRGTEEVSATAVSSSSGTPTPSKSKKNYIMMEKEEDDKASVRTVAKEEESVKKTPQAPENIILVQSKDGKAEVKTQMEEEEKTEHEMLKKEEV